LKIKNTKIYKGSANKKAGLDFPKPGKFKNTKKYFQKNAHRLADIGFYLIL